MNSLRLDWILSISGSRGKECLKEARKWSGERPLFEDQRQRMGETSRRERMIFEALRTSKEGRARASISMERRVG